jgi:hypothetical protein
MNKAHTILGAVAAASLAGAASADINLTFDNFIAAGAQFSMTDDGAGNSDLAGTVDSALGAFTLNSGENFTWADDLCVMIANDDLSELHMQIGGYSDFGATHRFVWPTGASGDPGTAAGGTVDIGGIDVTGYKLWLGNGYGSGGDGDWSGGIDLVGSVEYVPAPGALALLGLAGVSARRRRN